MTIKQLRQGEFFTKKSIEYPTESQVWIRGEYDRELKKYECTAFSDINKACYITGNKEVFVDFIF